MSTQLTIHISRTSVHVAEVLRSNQEIIQQFDFELQESSPITYKNKLKSVFESINTLKEEYAEYTLAWSTKNQTLVPFSVFNESSAIEIYQLMFGVPEDKKMIDYNRLMELNMVNVYEIPDWVKSFFIIKFPQIVIKHEHAMNMRALFQQGSFKRKIIVGFNDEYVNISIIQKNELSFSNSFVYQTKEDVLYHLLFVIEQENLTNEKGELNFYYVGDHSKNMATQTKSQIEQHNLLTKFEFNTFDSMLKLQTLCV